VQLGFSLELIRWAIWRVGSRVFAFAWEVGQVVKHLDNEANLMAEKTEIRSINNMLIANSQGSTEGVVNVGLGTGQIM
jgi:hypothetical protein